jgi:hypothetical protein
MAVHRSGRAECGEAIRNILAKFDEGTKTRKLEGHQKRKLDDGTKTRMAAGRH